jgi:hypothetical protein
MTLRLTGVLDFVHHPGLKNYNMFQKLGLFPSSGEGKMMPTLLGPFERANLTGPVIEVSSF